MRLLTPGGADLLRLELGELPAEVDAVEVVLVYQKHS